MIGSESWISGVGANAIAYYATATIYSFKKLSYCVRKSFEINIAELADLIFEFDEPVSKYQYFSFMPVPKNLGFVKHSLGNFI